MKICEKLKELHLQEKVLCAFCVMVSAILILNVIVDLIHIGVSLSSKRGIAVQLNNLETRVEVLEEKVK